MNETEPFGRVPKGIYTAGLSPQAITLYGWLSAAYGGFEVIRPAVATLAADLGWSASTVQRHSRELEEAGWLAVAKRPGTSSIYRLTADTRSAARKRRSPQGVVSDLTPLPQSSVLPHPSHPCDPIQLEETARETTKKIFRGSPTPAGKLELVEWDSLFLDEGETPGGGTANGSAQRGDLKTAPGPRSAAAGLNGSARHR